MRKLARYPILWLLAVLACTLFTSSFSPAHAGTVDAYYQFRDYTDSPLNVRRVVITPIGPSGEYDGSFLSQKPINYSYATYPSLTNGYLLATNLITGYAYRVAFSDGFGEPTVTNYFGTNLSGTVGAVTNKTSYIQWVNGVAIQINGPYFNATITNTTTAGGSATNVTLRAGTGVSVTTNSSSDWTVTASEVPYSALTAAARLNITNAATQAAMDATNGFTAGSGASVTATNLAQATTNGSVVTINVSTQAVVKVMQNNFALTNNHASTVTLPTVVAGDTTFSGGTISLSTPGDSDEFDSSGAFTLANGNVTSDASGNLTATSFTGDGSGLTGISSGVSAAQVSAVIKTNDGYYTARHINLEGGMRNLRGTLASNVPPKILVISDNSFSTHEYLPLMTTNWLPLNGSFGKASGTQIGNYFYNAWNGLGTFSAEAGTDTFFARSHFMLANGGMVSNISSVVNGFTTSAIQVRGWKLSSFGTLQVLTNTVGGTTNLFRTIDCASGATLSAFVTNWTIPTITNLTVTVKSIGTNILMDIGQWNTNIYSGAVWDFWESQNFGFYPFTDTAAHSNYFRTFVLNSGYNAVIVDDIAGSNSLYSGISYFNDMLTNSGIDFIVTTPVAPTNDVPTWLDTRDAVLAAARDFNIAAIDVSPYFLNTALNGWQYFDEIHQIRTNALGNAARKRDAAISIGGQLVSAIGLNYEKFQPFGYTNLANPTPDISGKANLAGGNSFTGSQTFGGYLQSTGTLSSIILNYRNDNSRQFSAYATGSGVLFNDSAESGPWMTKSNIAGVTSLNFTPYGGASVVKFGDKSFLSYYGDGLNVTNLQATNIVGLQSSVFPTNSIPLGSATVTNIGLVSWRGYLVTVATNRAVGGWMWQTNGPSGAPVWGAFNPASQP